ncbi:MAG TPA: hypothetical protein PK977_09830 [Chitinophagaceae bacterium]|nr:hypothetical protein [Chitinophagaceae bacterium]HRF18459.1 hypothetical protein [Chitinophagaceae bacterium]
MTRYFIFTTMLFALLMAKPITTLAGTQQQSGHIATNHHSDDPGKAANTGHLPMGAKQHPGGEKAHSHVPSWDELAHIHHFHKNRLKKVRRHYSKCVFFSKLLLIICHAAILFVSYLHVTH